MGKNLSDVKIRDNSVGYSFNTHLGHSQAYAERQFEHLLYIVCQFIVTVVLFYFNIIRGLEIYRF